MRCTEQQCVDATHPSGGCTVDGKLYNVGDKIKRSECTECTCRSGKSNIGQDSYLECSNTNCQILLCREADQVKLPGQCCKTCTQTIKSAKNITIDNCPAGKTLILKLGQESKYAKDFSNIQIVDKTGLDRSVNVSKVPAGMFYPWTAGVVDVRWSAAAQRTSGDWDVTVCSYSIKVKGNNSSLLCQIQVILLLLSDAL
jgi:hypothetical protein